MILGNLGLLNKYSENREKAIEYFDQALNILIVDSADYFWTLYNKVHCIIEVREFPKAEKIIEQSKDVYYTNDSSTIPFESLKHFLVINKRFTQYNGESTDYIENVTIPFFKKRQDGYSIALSYYKTLEKH